MCAKCDYSSTSRINFKAHVARAHGKASGDEAVGTKKAEPQQLDVATIRSQPSGVFQPMLPLYAAAAAGGGDASTLRLQAGAAVVQPPAAAATVLPVYHLTVKGPDHHIFTFHPAAGKAEVVVGGGGEVAAASYSGHHKPAATFLPVVTTSYQQQQAPQPTSNGAAVSTETIWRPEYDSYLSSV
jgi:hypothetical protein